MACLSEFRLHKEKQLMRPLLIFGTVFLLAIVSATARFGQRDASAEKLSFPDATPSSPNSPTVAQSDEAGPEVKLILLALRPEGFETNEMQLNAGDYLFIVGNRTGLREVNVRMEREGKERVTATVGGRRRDWKQRLKLTPGTYLITADDNPDWSCRIVVGP